MNQRQYMNYLANQQAMMQSNQLAQYQAMQNANPYQQLGQAQGLGGVYGALFGGLCAHGYSTSMPNATETEKLAEIEAKPQSAYKLGDLWRTERKRELENAPTWLWFYTSLAFIALGIWVIV